MNILNIPYFVGGLSHLLPLYVLHHKYLRSNVEVKSQFLVNNRLQNLLKTRSVDCVSMDYFGDENLLLSNDHSKMRGYLIEKQREAYEKVKPALIIEDNSFSSPLIAEKNNVPRISIQRTGIFRTIDERYRNGNHVHSIRKGGTVESSTSVSNQHELEEPIFNDSDMHYLEQYPKPKAKIIPGIPTIECLPEDIEDRDSYFYSGPLIIIDKPSKNLTERLDEFLMMNKQKNIVFITTGTIDKTPIEKFIAYFVKWNYADL